MCARCGRGAPSHEHIEAVTCEHNLHACSCFIKGMLVLTDHRINTNAVTAPAEGYVHPLLALPGNPLAFHITDDAYERGEAGLFRMTIDDFIVLLMDAVSFFNTGRATAQARRIVNELEAQLAGGSCTSLRLGNWPSRYDSLCELCWAGKIVPVWLLCASRDL
jgi:hypothetical protein